MIFVNKTNGIEGTWVSCTRGCPMPTAREYERFVDDLEIAAELLRKSAHAA